MRADKSKKEKLVVFDVELLKLSVMVGLVLGFVSLGLGLVLGLEWWVRQWRLLRELLGLGLGVVYTYNYSEKILELKVKYLVVKYGMFVYWAVLVWLGWMGLVWVAGGGDVVEFDGQFVNYVAGVTRVSSWGLFLDAVVQAVKLVGLGLLVVLGFRFAKTTFNH